MYKVTQHALVTTKRENELGRAHVQWWGQTKKTKEVYTYIRDLLENYVYSFPNFMMRDEEMDFEEFNYWLGLITCKYYISYGFTMHPQCTTSSRKKYSKCLWVGV